MSALINKGGGKQAYRVELEGSGISIENVTIDSTPESPVYMQQTGTYSILAGQPKPVGKQNDELIEYDEATGRTKVYVYISGDWRSI